MSLVPPAAVLAARDLGVELGGRPIVRGVDLTVEQGEVVAVLGANGSGKSTLVKALLGLVPLRRGSVHLFGTPLDRFTAWSRVGYVPQRPSATAGVPASVGEVVASGRLGRRRPLFPQSRADREAVRRALAAVGLADRAHDRVALLSGGQQQRVLIARALAVEPDLLVLDEPTAGVDLAAQDTFAELAADLVAAGSTILLVMHELGAFESLIRRTVVMRHGRAVYDGEPLPSFQDLPHSHAHHVPLTGPRDHRPDLGAPLDRVAGEELR